MKNTEWGGSSDTPAPDRHERDLPIKTFDPSLKLFRETVVVPDLIPTLHRNAVIPKPETWKVISVQCGSPKRSGEHRYFPTPDGYMFEPCSRPSHSKEVVLPKLRPGVFP